MAIIKWIHISDIHIKSAEKHLEKYNSEIVLKALFEDTSARTNIAPELANLDFAFITGDSAWSGADGDSIDEYKEVYERLISPLSEHANINIDKIFVVPGNHDIARSKIDDEVKKLESALTTRDSISELFVVPKIRDEDRKKIFSRLEGYAKYVSEHFPHLIMNPSSLTFTKDIPKTESAPLIKVVGLNSAWLARGGKEDKENIALGEPVVRELLDFEKDPSCLTIALVHHPLNNVWYKECEESTLQNVRANADFLLAGHVHKPDFRSLLRTTGSCIEIVGGAIYDGDRWSSNSYNYVCFDTETLLGHAYLRRYCDNVPTGPEWQPDTISTGKKRMGVLHIRIIRDAVEDSELYSTFEQLKTLVAEQKKELDNRPLLAKSHPDKDSMSILFPNVYIEPLVRPSRRPSGTPILLSEWMDNHGESVNKVLLLGSPGTGKTTSLISLQHNAANNFIAGITDCIPIFVEAQNIDWKNTPNIESIANSIMEDFNKAHPRQMIRGISFDKIMLYIDGIDEAFPNVYQKMDIFDPSQVRLDFLHVMTCRDDFFKRNLYSDDFCEQYDEILVMEPWTIDREVPDFIDKYHKHINETIDTEKRKELLRIIRDFAESPGMQLSPLIVTMLLFIWRYDYDQTIQNLPKTFASLIERLMQIWAKRESDNDACIFKNTDKLLSAYEETAWFLYNNKRPKIEDLAKALSEKINMPYKKLVQDRGLLSILRTVKNGADKQETHVVSFIHQAIYEYLLAKRLTDTLKGKTTDIEIIGRPLGHIINRLTRELLSTSSIEERSAIVAHLQQEYGKLHLKAYGFFGKIKHHFRCFDAVLQYEKENIIRRHNICYFWGRLESDMDVALIPKLFEKILNGSIIEHEVVCTTVGSCILLMNDPDLERAYLNRLSDNGSWDRCNRTYHRVYYGDAGYTDPDAFINDNFQEGKDDWQKTRQAILNRLNSREERAFKLRSLDLITFHRFCQTRGTPALNTEQIAILENCINAPIGLSNERIAILKEEHKRLMDLFAKTKDA